VKPEGPPADVGTTEERIVRTKKSIRQSIIASRLGAARCRDACGWRKN